MSIPAINWCIEQAGLPPGQWVVLFHLCHCHNHETGRCDPSQEYLSKMTGMGVRTVRRHLSDMENEGLISRSKRGVDGGGRLSDSYILGHEPAKLAANVTGQSVRTNRPNLVKNVHEMAGKQEVTGKEQEDAREEGLFSEKEAPKKKQTPLSIFSEVMSERSAADFIDHRKQIRKPVTNVAASRIANSLRNHHDPDAVIDLSIKNGWTGVFPERVPKPASVQSSYAARIRDIQRGTAR